MAEVVARSQRGKRVRVQLVFDSKNPDSVSRTQQQFRDEVDINAIVAKGLRDGILADPEAIAGRRAVFADFASMPDFLTTQNRVARVRAVFDELPANVRSRFENEPAQCIEFLADPKNFEEGIELGLIPRPKKGKYSKPFVFDPDDPTSLPPPIKSNTPAGGSSPASASTPVPAAATGIAPAATPAG